jgi:aspartate carbamoyltransferase catalytic subunit
MSVVSLSELTLQQVESVFINSDFFKTKNVNPLLSETIVANIFFEASTRTRMSFEMATMRLGAKSILFSGKMGTSLEKDESYLDTLLNIAAMKPNIMVIRCGDDVDLRALKKQIDVPIINAGWGAQGHPSQALLDIATLRSKDKHMEKERVLFVGDIKHSRVVSSHLELASIMKYEVAFCGPAVYMPANSKVPVFSTLKEGMAWATTVIFLRFQKERHQAGVESVKTESFQLNAETLKYLKSDSLFLHPGPVNWGVEMTEDVLKDPRCMILDQVNHGVYIRMALIYMVSKGEL